MENLSAEASSMANHSLYDSSLPPLPTYTLEPKPDLLPFISDLWLSLVLPVVVYWVASLFFHAIDTLDLFPQYRLHTPEEITKRNHATRYEVARDVIIQQIIQVITGYALAITEPQEMIGKTDYDIAVWATRIRLAQRALPGLLGLVGLNATAISKSMSSSHPLLAGVLAGGYYPVTSTDSAAAAAPTFTAWELTLAKAIYYVFIPAVQYFVAVFILDTWQYFLHRLMHVNRWLYSKFYQNETPFAEKKNNLLTMFFLQQLSTLDTIVSTSLTPTVPFTTTRWRASSSIPLAPASDSRSRA
jgi:sphinganine C4-monooxygenase